MRRIGAAIIVLAALSSFAQSTQSDPKGSSVLEKETVAPLVRLQAPTSLIATPQALGVLFGPVTCDSSGNFYVRVGNSPADLLQQPVVQFSSDGRTTHAFDLKSVPDLPQTVVATHFATDPHGAVYYILRTTRQKPDDTERLFVAAFGASGSYRTKTEIPASIIPEVIAAFPSGSLFVIGVETKEGKTTRLVGKIDEAGHFTAWSQAASKDAASDTANRAPNPLQIGNAVAGDDGFIHVLRPEGNPEVQIWSEAGQMVRSMPIKPPIQDADAFDLMVTPGRYLLKFQPRRDPSQAKQVRRVIYGVFNSMTGDIITYVDPAELRGMLTCYANQELTFLVPVGTKFSLAKIRIP